MKTRRALIAPAILIVLLALTGTAVAAQFAYVFQVYADNSCRSFVVEFYPDGEAKCRGDASTFTYWCDPTASTCEALMAAPPAIPVCGSEPTRSHEDLLVTLQP